MKRNLLSRNQRLKVFIKLQEHPKYDALSEKLQDVLDLFAAGTPQREISKMYNVPHGTPWAYQESIFKKYKLIVYLGKQRNAHTQGYYRAMTMYEIAQKFNIV